MTQPVVGSVDPATGNTLNPCHGCGAVDDHPRHITIHSFVDDSQNLIKHFDCCAAGGCGYCAEVVASADGKKGEELRQHLVAQPAIDRNEGLAPVTGA
ncbi:MAG: hypothetical protein NVS3B1_21370 [Marmoricola sp.]